MHTIQKVHCGFINVVNDLKTQGVIIKTSQTENILESFKLIVKGKVFWAHANELFVWSLSFKDVPEKELFSDDESAKINEQANNLNNDEVENASEVVSDTYFGDNDEVQGFEQQHGESNDKEVSSDPFNIYNLLDKRTKEVRTTDTSTSIPYPPGFTPANDIPACNNQDIPCRQGVIREYWKRQKTPWTESLLKVLVMGLRSRKAVPYWR
ncbi:hypothetical protein Tco_0258345, partial [Tanacetum coccineum]